MRNSISHIRKHRLFLLIAGFLFTIHSMPLSAQQHLIVNKDNTRPETSRHFNSFNQASLIVTRHNGYNEIQWSASGNDAIHNFIIEYSFDGINFQSAGQVLSTNGSYYHKHYIGDTRSLLYRIRIQQATGKLNYSGAIFLEGTEISPVQLYTNIVRGNVVNVNAQFPVERVTIESGNGMQLFAKDVNGVSNFIPIAIPSLNRGIYFITFYGNGWKSTSSFVIG